MYKLSKKYLRMNVVVLCVVLASWFISCETDNLGEVCTGTITTRYELREAIDTIRETQGETADFNSIDTSCVTDMSGLFNVIDSAGISVYRQFNGDISGWDTRNVTNMKNMFNSANNFNQDVGNWDTSKVTDMRYMFNYAYAFNQNIGRWNTSKVTTMRSMFDDATVFNQPIGNWDTSKVTNMEQMFVSANAFNQNLTGWSNASAPNTTGMFFSAQAMSPTNMAPWMPGAIPAAPQNVSATAASGQVQLSWDAVVNATNYTVYSSTSTGIDITNASSYSATFNINSDPSNPTTSYTSTGLTAGTAYYYVITARHRGGESAASTEVSATP